MAAPGMLNQGMSDDGVHPSVYNCPPCDGVNFSDKALRYGYNVRSLGALLVLDKLKRVVIDDGAPD